MDRDTVGQLFVWGIILTVFVGLPALLRRSRLRAFQRNREGACGRCGRPLNDQPGGYMEGFRVCPRCAARQRRSTILGLGFLGLLATVTMVAAGLGVLEDARQGQFGPWWIYVVVFGSGLGLIGLSIFVWRQTQAANRRAATNDAAAARRYDDGGEYQP